MQKKNIILVSIIIIIIIVLTIIILLPHKSLNKNYEASTDKAVDKNVGKNSGYIVDSSDLVDANNLITDIKESDLTTEEIAGLVKMREEEKLARDVYTTLGQIWGLNIFSNIASSEQTHTDAVKALITRYEIPDPVENNDVGVFQAPEMQTLYDTLINQGKISSIEALKVGATIEDLDINDLDILKKATDKADILVVYNNLQKGSRNHMRAFVKNLSSQGVTYSPSYISQETYSSIISSNQERGRI